MLSASVLLTFVTLLVLSARGLAQSNTSCVQVVDSSEADVSPYPSDEPSLTFTMEAATTLMTNTVNVVIVVDGSSSIVADDFILEQQFAKDTAAAFARRKIFENGGTASYVQFSDDASDEGTFTSTESFDAHVDTVYQTGEGTDIIGGIEAGKALLNANPSSFSFMVLITDGDGYGDPTEAAEEAKADNTTTIFAVGVGSSVTIDTLLAIAGTETNVFSVTDFSSLEAAVADIEVIADETVLPCPATDVSITIEFTSRVLSVASPSATITGDNRVTFTAENLEDNPTQFAVGLATCGLVTSVDYDDEQRNDPDFSRLPDPTCLEGPRHGIRAAHLATFIVVSAVVTSVLASIVGGDASSTPVVAKPRVEQSQLPLPTTVEQPRQKEGTTVEQPQIPVRSTVPSTVPDANSAIKRISSRNEEASEGGLHAPSAVDRESADSKGLHEETPPKEQGEGVSDSAAPPVDPSDDVNELAALLRRVSQPGPSSAMLRLLIAQAQFLAILSLVDSVGSERSWLSDFLEGLRWINLWPRNEADSEDETFFEKDNDIDEEGFVGNLVSFSCFFLPLLVLHLLIVSAIEAHWLQGMKRDDLSNARTGFEEDVQQVGSPPPSYDQIGMESADDDDANLGAGGAGSIGEGGAAGGDQLEPVARCRDRSSSLWIHFPHVELLFLLFAFQGSLAAQIEVLRHGNGALFVVAAIVLVAYPVFVIAVVFRIIIVRVLPGGTGLVFTPGTKDRYYTDNNGSRDCRKFFGRVLQGLKEDQSALAWAKKGVWMTDKIDDTKKQRLRNWFMIGFEPLFVDYTKSGSWFAVYLLLESALVACIGVLLESHSQLQLMLFLGLNLVAFPLLVFVKPYSNRLVEIIATSRVGVNTVCMALLVGAEVEGDSAHAERMETAVAVLNLILMVALAVPVFVDNGVVLVGTACVTIHKTIASRGTRKDQTTERAGRGMFTDWMAKWLEMIRRNLVAYAADVVNGLRKPHRA